MYMNSSFFSRRFLARVFVATCFLLLVSWVIPAQGAVDSASSVAQISATVGDLNRGVTDAKANYERTKSSQDEQSLKNVLLERNHALRILISKNPDALEDSALSSSFVSSLAAADQALVEQEVELTGSIRSYHLDDFVSRKAIQKTFFLTDEHRAYDLAGSRADIATGTRVRVKGHALGRILVLGSKSTVQTLGESAAANGVSQSASPAPSVMKVAVIMVDFPDAPAQNRTNVEAVDAMRQVKSFYQASSYGKTRVDVRVFGWYRSSIALSTLGCGNAFDFARNAIELSDSAINFRQYEYVSIYAPSAVWCFGVGGLGYLESLNFQTDDGLTSLGVALVFQKYYQIFAHELGHNLGLLHSNSFDCPRVFPPREGPSCVRQEYGDSFDMMGFGTGQFNVIQKNLLGYLAPSQIKTITRSGIYPIEALETNTAGVKALRIRRWNSPISDSFSSEIWIEYRRTGPESGEGALVHVPEANNFGPYLLHLKNGNFYLKTGQSIYDYDSKTKIRAVSTTLGDIRKLRVEVTLNAPPPSRMASLSGVVTLLGSDPSSVLVPQTTLLLDGTQSVTVDGVDYARQDVQSNFSFGKIQPGLHTVSLRLPPGFIRAEYLFCEWQRNCVRPNAVWRTGTTASMNIFEDTDGYLVWRLTRDPSIVLEKSRIVGLVLNNNRTAGARKANVPIMLFGGASQNTNANGKFEFTNLTPGQHVISATSFFNTPSEISFCLVREGNAVPSNCHTQWMPFPLVFFVIIPPGSYADVWLNSISSTAESFQSSTFAETLQGLRAALQSLRDLLESARR